MLRRLVNFALLTGVLLQFIAVVDAAGSKGKSSRGRRRRCPKACVHKFNNYQKGSPGPPGPRGPKGGRLLLPICKSDEYLTSDGIRLKCKRFDFTKACSALTQQCRSSVIKDEGVKKVHPVAKSGKMIQFTKNNIIQEIDMDTWDAEAFYIGPSLFVGLSHLGLNAFRMYKWEESDRKPEFKTFQDIKASFSRNWSPFKIGDVQYFVIAIVNSRLNCPIFHWNARDGKFVKFWQELPCTRAYDVATFLLQGVQHIVISNYDPASSIGVFRWNGTGFETVQRINATAMYVEPFKIGGDTYLALSAYKEMAPIVTLYKWNGKRFASMEELHTNYRPYEVTAFSTGQQHFLAIATISIENSDDSTIVLLKWNGKKFRSFQNISSEAARRVSAISSPLMGEETTYIAAVNDKEYPAIYTLDRDNGNSFKLLHTITQDNKDNNGNVYNKGARDISFFEMGGNVYLLMSTHREMCVYKGVSVDSKNTDGT